VTFAPSLFLPKAGSMEVEVEVSTHSESQSNLLTGPSPRRLTIALVAVLIAACSAPAGPEIVIDETGWEAVPATAAAGGGKFDLTVSNDTNTQQEFVVVVICDAVSIDAADEVNYTPANQDPDALPIVDGQLDLQRSGLCGDPGSPDTALYTLVYPDYEASEGQPSNPEAMTPGTVAPKTDTTITIGGFEGGGEPGTYVILSWSPGGYEAGHYTEFTIKE
jgi:hypothetical protein